MVDAHAAPPLRTEDITAHWGEDRSVRNAGITIQSLAAGRATLRMRVADDMLNGLGVCHGGHIFLLADTALAYAAMAGDEPHVSSWGSISFLKPAQPGDVLEADCTRIHEQGRSSLFDATVTNQHGAVIALFRGQAMRVRPSVVPQEKE